MPSVSSSQSARSAGRPSRGVSSSRRSCRVWGSCSMRLDTCALPSICPAWLRVMPVRANSSMPARQSAELIQCHWRRVPSQKVMVTSRLSGRGPGNERDSRGVHRGDGRDLPIVYVRKKPARMGGLSRWRSEVQGGGEPQAAAFFQYSTGSRSGLSVAGCPVGLPVVGIAVAFQEIRVQQVGNAGVQRQILSCFVGATQVEHAIGLDIADGVVQRPILVGQVGVLIAEACTLATVLALQPQAQAVGGVPVELGIQQMLGSLGQFVAFVLPTFLLAIGVGVIAAQCPAWGEPPTGGKLQALGDCFIDVDLRRTGAIGVAGAKRIGNRRATGDLVIKLVVE